MDASLVPEGNPRLSPTRFVKVFLHGEPFGRKINLATHNNYDSLSSTLKRLGSNYSLSQYQLSGLAMSEEQGAIDDDFMFLYDNMDGYRFFLGEVPWEDFAVSVKKIYILPGEKQDDNEEYLEEGDANNGDGITGAAADGDDDAAGENGALDAVVAEDEGDGADDDGDGAGGEDGDGAYDDEDEAVGDDAGAEDNDGGAAK
ncbi:putative auxin-responsive protein IAA29 [Triticum dicoccoides]|uniref:putative auxin-responsive protein IAA29 n=1 Tax=Triticum dicoccoides TaxID=85692 RepID=UPI000E7B3D92|nr:putative auxin-responsive protein IAA29 [Triticum dicoccoides]